MKIAGRFTDKQWLALSEKLERNPTDDLWDCAYRSFYRVRVDTRYLRPMASILNAGTVSGEGFAMVAIFCTLVEFLESCEQGLNFRMLKKGEQFGQFEYGPRRAPDCFKRFLHDRKPFDTLFPKNLIDSFYQNVRCGLIHEAQTKGGWIISAATSSGALVSENGSEITLFRNRLIPALEEYFEDYRGRLLADSPPSTRAAFRRKFNHLCKG